MKKINIVLFLLSLSLILITNKWLYYFYERMCLDIFITFVILINLTILDRNEKFSNIKLLVSFCGLVAMILLPKQMEGDNLFIYRVIGNVDGYKSQSLILTMDIIFGLSLISFLILETFLLFKLRFK